MNEVMLSSDDHGVCSLTAAARALPRPPLLAVMAPLRRQLRVQTHRDATRPRQVQERSTQRRSKTTKTKTRTSKAANATADFSSQWLQILWVCGVEGNKHIVIVISIS
mmetsp:Transcript_7504/g.20902  ORF Transcript_7504/g.20902 Transcript_7504/m.20902 type:complete len:108 (-) Transcript_7504:3-326(-)